MQALRNRMSGRLHSTHTYFPLSPPTTVPIILALPFVHTSQYYIVQGVSQLISTNDKDNGESRDSRDCRCEGDSLLIFSCRWHYF